MVSDDELVLQHSPLQTKRKLSRLKRAADTVVPAQSPQLSPLGPSDNRLNASVLDKAQTRAEKDDEDESGDKDHPQTSPAKAEDQTQIEPSEAQQEQSDADGGSGNEVGESEASDTASGNPSKQEKEYWDEEEELMQYLESKGAGKDGEHSQAEASADVSASKQAESVAGLGSGTQDSDSEEEEAEGESEPQNNRGKKRHRGASDDTNAETQRILREAAKHSCIGQGALPEIKPLDGVLARISSRVDQAAARAAAALAATPKRGTIKTQQQHPVAHNDMDDEDDLIIEDDEDPIGNISLSMALGSETQPELPVFQGKIVPSSVDRPRVQETTPWRRRPVSPLPGPSSGGVDFAMLAHAGKDSRVTPENPKAELEQAAGEAVRKPLDAQPQLYVSPVKEPAAEVTEPEEQPMASPGGNSGRAAEDEAEEEKESEEEMSVGSSSSSEDEDSGDEESPDAQLRAKQEARLLLRDARPTARRTEFFEEEAEMSEDEGHSEDGSDGGEDDEHDKLLDDLIGHEKERRRDEKLRAKAHAEWQEKQDEADVQAVLNGIRGGFRKPKAHFLHEEDDGSLAAARRRRAAMQEGGADSGSGGEPDSSSDSDSEDERPNGAQAAMVDLDGELSDEEAKAGLRRYQEAKMLAESEDQEPVAFELVDADSQALLDSLAAQTTRAKPDVEPPQSQFGFAAGEIRRGSVKASFLGKIAPAAQTTRTSSQQNTRSYVFGREDSQSAADPIEGGSAAPCVPAPLGGIKRAVQPVRKGQTARTSLLDMLEPGERGAAAAATAGPTSFDITSLVGRRQNSLPMRR